MCSETMMMCMKNGMSMSAEMMCMMQDCSDMCDMAMKCLMRMSPMCPKVCGMCAEMCMSCATMCEKMANGNEMMMRCAEMCRRCADSCTMMSKMPMAA